MARRTTQGAPRQGPRRGQYAASLRGSLTERKASGRDEPLNVGVNGFLHRARQHPSVNERTHSKLFRLHTGMYALYQTRTQSPGHWIKHREKKVQRVAGQERPGPGGRAGPDFQGSFRMDGASCVDGIHLVPEFLVHSNKGPHSHCRAHAAATRAGLYIYKGQFPYRCLLGEHVPKKELSNAEK